MKPRHQAPDWALLIEQLLQGGQTMADISKAMGYIVSDRMLGHYKRGVQPLYFRGEPLIELWCSATQHTRTDLPMIAVRLPYRVPYSAKRAELVVIPDPPRRRGRPPGSRNKATASEGTEP